MRLLKILLRIAGVLAVWYLLSQYVSGDSRELSRSKDQLILTQQERLSIKDKKIEAQGYLIQGQHLLIEALKENNALYKIKCQMLAEDKEYLSTALSNLNSPSQQNE